MINTSITVDSSLLPETEDIRSNFLKEYFCELVASSKKVPEGWQIDLTRPPTNDYYIDPNLSKGLRWWSENFDPVQIKDIPFAFHNTLGFQLSFQDSWTLYSWSKYFAGLHNTNLTDYEVTVLHLDDHDDFMSPRLFIDEESGNWIDGITGQNVDLLDPQSIKESIESGAIGIGSFLAPLLHRLPRVHVRHLCSTEYLAERGGTHSISINTIEDNLLAPKKLRPAIGHSRTAADETRSSHTYLVTDDLNNWLTDIPDGPILVHFDMDYFNNRYNGDSDWIYHGAKYDPSESQVLDRIEEIFNAFQKHKITKKIADVAVALSPGFFPADLWATSITRISKNCKSLEIVS